MRNTLKCLGGDISPHLQYSAELESSGDHRSISMRYKLTEMGSTNLKKVGKRLEEWFTQKASLFII